MGTVKHDHLIQGRAFLAQFQNTLRHKGGLFIGIAGIYQFAKLNVGNPVSGVGLELRVIAAAVIGGASLSGGRGTVLGTLSGALLMQTISSGCTQLGVTNPVQDIILGVIIVTAVTVDQIRQGRSS